jgi:hypothetical protein
MAHRNQDYQWPFSSRRHLAVCLSQLVRNQVTTVNNRALISLCRVVYYLMQKEIKRLHESSLERDELAAEALEEAEEAPLLGSP